MMQGKEAAQFKTEKKPEAVVIMETTAKWNAGKLLSEFEICMWNCAIKNALGAPGWLSQSV